MAFLRTIFILIIIFYVIRLFARYILPSLFRNYMDSKMEEYSMRQKRQQQQAKKHEGEITINFSGGKSQKKPSDGEYVDYVEVKD